MPRWRTRRTRKSIVAKLTVTGLIVTVLPMLAWQVHASATGACSPPTNPIVCENSQQGSPKSDWFVGGNYGDIAGFGSAESVTAGSTLQFKVDTTLVHNYEIDIYRLGWYGGAGARLVSIVPPRADVSLPHAQPNCLSVSATGLVDCGNWGVSATWNVPANAVSGLYVANFNRLDAPGENQFPFVVRDEASHSDIVVQTSDQTWEAYNTYGGNSLYVGTCGCSDNGRAYKVSYNRPYLNSGTQNFYNAEIPTIRWLERNGYDVSYLSSVDVSRNPALLRNHKTFVSNGHDEYWNAPQRTGVEQARAAGVNLAFLSGNEMYWKTRFEASVDGSNTAYRTLVCYKESQESPVVKLDPTPTWTGTWRDPALSPPADGGRPENAVTGTLYRVNGYRFDALQVPATYAQDRLWRGTSVATLTGNQVATFANGTLGYEWDTDPIGPSRPPGAIDLSSTTVTIPTGEQVLLDNGFRYGTGTMTHNLVMYRDQVSHALVFGAGTVNWSWGLDSEHLYTDLAQGLTVPADPRIQQATVNFLADMGAQPLTLQAGLGTASASTDTVGPTVSIATPAAGGTVPALSPVTVSGTATDTGGGSVARVEVSLDGGTTWIPATGLGSWSYTWTPTALGSATLLVRAEDDSANIGAMAQRQVTVGPQQCPCTLFQTRTPSTVDSGDGSAVELGVKFSATVNGTVTGVRFYKSTANSGTHTGTLWTAGGTVLATGTFGGESPSGWQTLTFAAPVQIRGGRTYVVSYATTTGHYSADAGFFAGSGAGLAPLIAPADGGPAGGQGVYRYGSGFPTSTFGSTNYWVDPIFATTGGDNTPPTVTSTVPAANASGAPTETGITATFDKSVDPTTLQFTVTGPGGTAVPGTAAVADDGLSATFTSTSRLAASTAYTASVRVSDGFGVPMPAPFSWTFTTGTDPCPCTLFRQAVPAVQDSGDPNQVELGVKFQTTVNALVTSVRYYKSSANGGTHTGSLWSSTGTLLATGTFTNETDSGWQTLTFASPVAIRANTTYVASYNAPSGHYASAGGYFTSSGAGTAPLVAPSSPAAGGQGVYRYGSGAMPAASYNGTNYYVDVVVTTAGADNTPPAVTSTTPVAAATSVPVTVSATATFSEPVDPSSVQFTLTPAGGSPLTGAVSLSNGGTTAQFNPTADLSPATTYTASVRATDVIGNLMPSPFTWSFTTNSGGPTCPCSVFRGADAPASADTDVSPIELGMKWQSSVDGWITGVRYYKVATTSGTHTGSLWSAAGAPLDTGTFTNETASGWQTLTFASPVPVTANTTYVVSYYSPVGKFGYTGGYFAAAHTNGPLTGLQTATGTPNGSYRYGSGGGFPTGNGGGTNYWADVVFATTAP